MKIIAITGGIGSGKSTLIFLLKSIGYCVFSADDIVAEVVSFNETVKKSIIYIFGEDAYKNGVYNREYIRNVVFEDSEKKQILEAIIHPVVHNLFNEKVKQINNVMPTAWIFYEVPLLYETNTYKNYDITILVTTDENVKIDRIMESRKLSIMEIKKIMQIQISDDIKKSLATYIIDNSYSKQKLMDNMLNILQQIKEK